MIALPRRERVSHCDECGSSAEHACWNSDPKLYPFRPSDATNSGAEAIRGKTHFSAGGQWEWPHRFRCAFSVSRPLTGPTWQSGFTEMGLKQPRPTTVRVEWAALNPP